MRAPEGGIPYASIRLKAPGHKLRFSNTPLKVEAGDDQTITLLTEPWVRFLVMPSGVEFPVENVASAISVDASISQKLSRTGRIHARKQRVMQLVAAKRATHEDG